MSRTEAQAELAKLLVPVNARTGEPMARMWTVGDWIRDTFFPFIRRKWKLSTASTSGDRIRLHLIGDLEHLELQSVTRDLLQQYLEQKAARGLSFSVVDHLRWDLRAIFRLAVQDRVLSSNPADLLFTPRTVARPSRRVLGPEQIRAIFDVLDLRGQLLIRLALFSGMRPGEILALRWQHVAEDHVEVMQRLYRGKLARPKTERSTRKVALSVSTRELMKEWREKRNPEELEGWVFPSARPSRPLGRDSCWRWILGPALKGIGFEWATFQVLRRTHATLARQAGVDPKLVADQLGHGIGVNLDVYSVSCLEQRQQVVQTLELMIGWSANTQATSEAVNCAF
jgi:integrase